MSDERITFPAAAIDEGEIREVVGTLKSGWITTGPKVQQFEEEFADNVGAEHATALHLRT